MNDIQDEAAKILQELERLSGKTISKSRRDRDRMTGYIANKLLTIRRDTYDTCRKEFKGQVVALIGSCLDRDPTMQKVVRAIEEL